MVCLKNSLKWYGDLGASSLPFSFSHGNGMSPGQLWSDNLFPSILDSAISEIPCIYLPGSLWPIHGVLYFYHGIHQRAVGTFGPCSPHICEETVIQTELRKLVLRNKEQLRQNVKDETILATFCEIPQCFNWSLRGTLSCETLDYICEKVKHWITSVRSAGKYRGPHSKKTLPLWLNV